jgi:hypothetical protein
MSEGKLIPLPSWFSDEKCKDLIKWIDSLTIGEVEDLKTLKARCERYESALESITAHESNDSDILCDHFRQIAKAALEHK